MNRILLFLIVAVFAGCADRTRSNAFSATELDVLYKPLYANGFAIYSYKNSTVLEIKKPWQGSMDNRMFYFFSRRGELPPPGFDGLVIELPLRKVVSMSTSYTAFIEALGSDSTICGVSGAQFVYSPAILKRIDNREIRNVGYESGLNYELLAETNPDVMFIYGVSGENSVVTDKVKEMGIKVVYLGDYLENSPLGRAEWIVALGELFDKRELAVSIFDSVSTSYNDVKAMAMSAVGRPKVMLNAPWRDTWFVPGDQSYMVRLITDAAGDYVCKGHDNDKSRPISAEAAYVYALDADIWLNPGSANTLDELLSANPNFSNIRPVLNKKVYNNNARSTASGGSDFWESGVIRPHVVLMDMIGILHPEIIADRELFYFHKIE